MSSRDWTIVLLVIVGVVVLLPLLGMSFWGGGMMGPGGMMGRGMMGGWGPGFGYGGFGGGFGLLFMLLVIVGVVLIVSGLTRKDAKADDAQQILRARLARGEITKEQFDELRQALQ